MTATALVERLGAAGCLLAVEGNSVKVRGPRRALTAEVLAELRERKAEVIDLLTHRPGIGAPAECPWCGSFVAPYLILLGDGSRALLCTGCRAWVVVGGAA